MMNFHWFVRNTNTVPQAHAQNDGWNEPLADISIESDGQKTAPNELFSAGTFTVNSKEDINALPSERLEKCTRSNTDFPCWKDSYRSSPAEFLLQKINF